MFRHCPNCESKNVIIYETGDVDSYCLDCAFTWRQTENYIHVSKRVLERLADSAKTQDPAQGSDRGSED